MIQMITQEGAVRFADGFAGDKTYADPMLQNGEQLEKNLLGAFSDPQHYCVFGVYDEQVLLGLFSFLIVKEESYLEMLVGLSRAERAYDEMMAYLKGHFPGFSAHFVYHPANFLMENCLRSSGASFEPEQCKLILKKPPAFSSERSVVPYSYAYRAGYLVIHDDNERYWTAEKVLAALDRFRVFLALDGSQVVGYLDVTYCFEENEPYDLFVSEAYRRRGYARALLAKAIEANGEKKLSVLIDREDDASWGLYASMGFEEDPSARSRTAHLNL